VRSRRLVDCGRRPLKLDVRFHMCPRLSLVLVICSLCSVSAVADAQVFRLPATSGPALLDQCSRDTPKDVSSFWVASAADVAKLEVLLVPVLRSLLDGRFLLPLDPLGRFHRQYVGFTKNRKRYIYGNFYPRGSESDPEEEIEPMKLCDGGDAFWGVVFSPETKLFEDISFNGNG
jgi:hypothetical protein